MEYLIRIWYVSDQYILIVRSWSIFMPLTDLISWFEPTRSGTALFSYSPGRHILYLINYKLDPILDALNNEI